MNFVEKLWHGLRKLVDFLIVLLLAVMTIIIGVGVFYRYILNNAISWVEEFSRYCMIWFAMLGAMLALIKNEHVGVSVFINLLPARFKKTVEQIGRVLIIVFLGIVLGYSVFHLMSLQGQTSSALELPMWIPYLSISVGMFLMLLVAVRQLFGIAEVQSDDGLPLAEPQENKKS